MKCIPANNEVPQNPCNYAGRNLDPSAWAAMRRGTKNNPFTTAYDFAHGFSIGGYLDAQMDSFFWSLPAANVANITAGYDAQRSGILCHK
jgi:hypothetical protein